MRETHAQSLIERTRTHGLDQKAREPGGLGRTELAPRQRRQQDEAVADAGRRDVRRQFLGRVVAERMIDQDGGHRHVAAQDRASGLRRGRNGDRRAGLADRLPEETRGKGGRRGQQDVLARPLRDRHSLGARCGNER